MRAPRKKYLFVNESFDVCDAYLSELTLKHGANENRRCSEQERSNSTKIC